MLIVILKDVIINHFRVKGADIMKEAITLLYESKYDEAKNILGEVI